MGGRGSDDCTLRRFETSARRQLRRHGSACEPLGKTMPEGLPQALADAGGLLLIPGLSEISDNPRLLVTMSYLFGPEVEDYRYAADARDMAHETVPEIFMVTNMVPGVAAAAGAARSAAHGRRQAAGAVPASQGLAHRPELSPAAARHLAVLCRHAGRARARPDDVRRRHAGLRRAAGGSQGEGRELAGPACPARQRPQPRRRGGGQDAAGHAAARSARSRSPWCARIRSRAGRRSISASAARWTGSTGRSSAWSRGRTARAPKLLDELMTPLHAAGVRLRPRMDPGRRAGVGQSLPGPRRDLVRRRQGAAHDVAHDGARQSGRDLCRREAELGSGRSRCRVACANARAAGGSAPRDRDARRAWRDAGLPHRDRRRFGPRDARPR